MELFVCAINAPLPFKGLKVWYRTALPNVLRQSDFDGVQNLLISTIYNYIFCSSAFQPKFVFSLLCLCVTQKALPLLFFSFFFSSFQGLFFFVTEEACEQDRVISLDTLANVLVNVLFIVKFRICKHNMPSGRSPSCHMLLKKISNARIKQEHVKSCFSTTKHIFPPMQCLGLPNLVGWWLTMMGSHVSRDPLNTCFSEITWEFKTIISSAVHCLWPQKLAG